MEQAIILYVNRRHKTLHTRKYFLKKAYNLLMTYNPDELVVSVDSEIADCKIYAYYKGQEIWWDTFNKLWGFGFVKNKNVYDYKGLIKIINNNKYIIKKEKLCVVLVELISSIKNLVELYISSFHSSKQIINNTKTKQICVSHENEEKKEKRIKELKQSASIYFESKKTTTFNNGKIVLKVYADDDKKIIHIYDKDHFDYYRSTSIGSKKVYGEKYRLKYY